MGICLMAMAVMASAQESTEVAPKPDEPRNPDRGNLPPDKPAIQERPIVVPPPLSNRDRTQAPERPPRPNGGGVVVPSSDLRQLIKDFQAARKIYMAQQRELLNDIKEASAEERSVIREQLKDKLDLWLQEQKDHIQTIRDQAKEMKNNVPAIRDVIDAAQEEGRPR